MRHVTSSLAAVEYTWPVTVWLDGMAGLLAGLGWRLEIREPVELRAAVRDLARSLLDAAGTSR